MSSPEPEATVATLSLSFPDNSTRLALSIPVSEAKEYANRALKWLRYLGFAISGQKGRLSTSSVSPEIDDYDAEIEARPYYFILDGEPHLLDAEAMNGRTSVWSSSQTSSSVSTNPCGPDFTNRICERDGTCVVSTEISGQCQAAHIIPHAKGSLYMQRLSDHRGKAHNPPERVDDIDDTRNGLLLVLLLHNTFGRREAAFLKTPNFGLTGRDIPSRPENSNPPMNRLTLQYFPGAKPGDMLLWGAPHNSDARQPEDTSEWPPDMLFDISYAAGALGAWGSKDFIEYLQTKTRDTYYLKENNPSSSGQTPGSGSGGPSTTQGAARTARLRERNKKKGQETPVDMIDIVCTSWELSARDYGQQHKQDTEAGEYARSKGKVENWLQSIEETV